MRDLRGTAVSSACAPSSCSLEKADLLHFSYTTEACYRADAAQRIMQDLEQRHSIPYARKDDMRTALHEALVNAVIHGNLGIHGTFRDADSLAAYYALVDAHLAHPSMRLLPVRVLCFIHEDTLTLEVSDSGSGYPYARYLSSLDALQPQQGLRLIHSCSDAVRVTRGGSCIQMDFILA